ncbi:hypothetical protein L227DRAFT_408878 [Lentinus tigrinus ALCF2SS1-6]|uniref:Uncharacterized protein n=1 Tax=Lentinus tigrinus ALCF2SS1-6 TaxID=1328759 RepID=A0A5C2SGP4_9APHY|nr:hypothetical protein L227DRAFT_408878 [Lentinus tigrinus ALCF2SS1-6]
MAPTTPHSRTLSRWCPAAVSTLSTSASRASARLCTSAQFLEPLRLRGDLCVTHQLLRSRRRFMWAHIRRLVVAMFVMLSIYACLPRHGHVYGTRTFRFPCSGVASDP